MKGTEANRFRLRLDKASKTAGRSSIHAGPTLLPKVPIAKNRPDAIKIARLAKADAGGIGGVARASDMGANLGHFRQGTQIRLGLR